MNDQAVEKLKKDIQEAKPEVSELTFKGCDKSLYDRMLDLIEDYQDLKYRMDRLEK